MFWKKKRVEAVVDHSDIFTAPRELTGIEKMEHEQQRAEREADRARLVNLHNQIAPTLEEIRRIEFRLYGGIPVQHYNYQHAQAIGFGQLAGIAGWGQSVANSLGI